MQRPAKRARLDGCFHPQSSSAAAPGDLQLRGLVSTVLQMASESRDPLAGGGAAAFRAAHRRDLVRLIAQELGHLGFGETAAHLEKASEIALQAPEVALFRQSVLGGDWAQAVSLIPAMQVDADAAAQMRFLVHEQEYLELLERGDMPQALKFLRQVVTPAQTDTGGRVRELSALVMCKTPAELRQEAKWDGAGGQSRQLLLQALQRFISPELLVPESRLVTMLQQAVAMQSINCLYHNNAAEPPKSLLADHVCKRDQLPRVMQHTLERHDDEVWYVAFSNNGTRLASASKDSTTVIWDVTNAFKVVCVLGGHTQSVSFVSWSPDDSKLLTCSNDFTVKLWDTSSGACLGTFDKHTDCVTACAWFPDGQQFATGSLDKRVYVWTTEGQLVREWTGARVNDLAISADGERLIVVDSEKRIVVRKIADGTMDSIPEQSSITSLFLSRDGQLLVNVSSQELHVWDLEGKRLVQKFQGQKQGRFVIRSVFGGANQSFVVSGSEDSLVYIWHRHYGHLLEVLPGHSGTVNSVSWNPKNPHMLASASDDNTIRIWGVEGTE